jgi:hypothetical protein
MKKILLFFMCLIAYEAHAQLKDLPVQYDSIYSDVLKEKRKLEIVLPTGYNPQNARKYEVLYTLLRPPVSPVRFLRI